MYLILFTQKTRPLLFFIVHADGAVYVNEVWYFNAFSQHSSLMILIKDW